MRKFAADRSNGSKSTEDQPKQEMFYYPKEAEINYEKRCVNLAWFGERYGKLQGPTMLDYNLVVYCIAKEVHTLPVSKWGKFFETPVDEEMDDEVKSILKKICSSYLVIYPEPGKKNWSNMVYYLIRNLMLKKGTKAVTMLLFKKLLVRLKAMCPYQLSKLFGDMSTVIIHNEFYLDEEARFELELPSELQSFYYHE